MAAITISSPGGPRTVGRVLERRKHPARTARRVAGAASLGLGAAAFVGIGIAARQAATSNEAGPTEGTDGTLFETNGATVDPQSPLLGEIAGGAVPNNASSDTGSVIAALTAPQGPSTTIDPSTTTAPGQPGAASTTPAPGATSVASTQPRSSTSNAPVTTGRSQVTTVTTLAPPTTAAGSAPQPTAPPTTQAPATTAPPTTAAPTTAPPTTQPPTTQPPTTQAPTTTAPPTTISSGS